MTLLKMTILITINIHDIYNMMLLINDFTNNNKLKHICNARFIKVISKFIKSKVIISIVMASIKSIMLNAVI
jgi:hypothetical protein